MRNQSCSISGRGSAIEDRNSATNSSGKKPWTASPVPVRRPMNAPVAAKPSATSIANTSSTGIPAGPAAKSMPDAKPTTR